MIFGIDGGGTRSRLKIQSISTGETLCYIEGGSTNVYSLTYEKVEQNLRDLIHRGCIRAGIQPAALQSGCLGSAGLDRAFEKQKFLDMFKNILSEHCRLTLCNDGEILLVGASSSFEGYALIAGTGSFALGRNASGTITRAGGLGYMLGDEGSAVWIAHQALMRTLRSIEGRDLHTHMLDALLDYFTLKSPSDFIHLAHYQFDKARFASYSPIVTKFAKQGDELAVDILKKAACELFALVESVHRRLDLLYPTLVLSGGVLEHDPIVKPLFIQMLNDKLPTIKVIEPLGTAVDGACMIAMQKLHE